jgi:glutamine amidotransferase
VIAVVDYGVGNLRSAAKGLERAAVEEGVDSAVVVTADPAVVQGADAVVLPGVGAFGACMRSLLESGLLPAVREAACSGKPFLGICVGMQILFEESDEFGPVAGLGILPGRVERLQSVDVPIPHMGWNAIRQHGQTPIMRRTAEGTYFYFVHSYAAHPAQEEQIVASVEYGGETVVAAVARENIFGTQFHPEKSQGAGIRLLGDFVARL